LVTSAGGLDVAEAGGTSVNYVQSQYIWSSPDSVALQALTPSMFLHGGPGNDILIASSGNNFLDGGDGSNFLIGGIGQGSDTFFIDPNPGNQTWSTVVNFHPGDALTFWNFQDGVSTLPWTASDGAPGYTGATIHSELSGPGTGVSASVTFAGVGLSTAQNSFDLSYGSSGGRNYLEIYFN
jgi:Ca2+-binding RTX toxin-like protein